MAGYNKSQHSIIQEIHCIHFARHHAWANLSFLVNRQYYWHGILIDIDWYSWNYCTCQCSSISKHSTFRVLQLSVSSKTSYDVISMQFIVGIQDCEEYFPEWVVVDSLCNMQYVVLCHEIVDSRSWTDLSIWLVVRLDVFPQALISGWRPPFTVRFGDSCVKQLGLKDSCSWHFTNTETAKPNECNSTWNSLCEGLWITTRIAGWNHYLLKCMQPIIELPRHWCISDSFRSMVSTLGIHTSNITTQGIISKYSMLIGCNKWFDWSINTSVWICIKIKLCNSWL